jgi:hypothetical protein
MSSAEQILYKGDLKITFGHIDMNDDFGEQRYMRITKKVRTGAQIHSVGILESQAWRITDDAWCKAMLPTMAQKIYGSSYTRFDVTRVHDAILESLEELIRLDPVKDDSLADEQDFMLKNLGLQETYARAPGVH